MKKLLSLSLLIGGLSGTLFAGATATSHTAYANTKSSNTLMANVQTSSGIIPLPDPNSPNKPCIKTSNNIIPLPDPNSPNKPC